MIKKSDRKSIRAPLTNDELRNLSIDDYLKINFTDDETRRLVEINEEREQERLRRSESLALEEQALVRDLKELGFPISSVWDLVNTTSRYSEAIPVLIKHLSLPYSDRLKEGIARALAVPEARPAWPLLVKEYKNARQGTENGVLLRAKHGLALALAHTATEDVIHEVIALASDISNGDSPLFFLSVLKRSKLPVAENAIKNLEQDAVFKKEIRRLQRKKKRS